MGCIRKRGDRLFLDYYDQFGERHRDLLPKGTTKKQAKDELREKEKLISKGVIVSKKKTPLFSEVAKDWLEYKKPKVRENTFDVFDGHIRNHFKDLDGAKINGITTATLEKFITAKQNQGMNINTLRKVLVTLGQILSYAVRHRFLDHNPLRDAERPRDPMEEKKEMRVLIPEQIRAFLGAEMDQKYKTLFLMAVMTGARQGELLGLKWGDLDLEKNQIHIQRTFTKGQFFPTKTKGSKRKIDLSPAVILELKKWKLACPKTKPNPTNPDGPEIEIDLMFPSETGGPMNYSNMIQRHYLPALEKAGIIEIERIKSKSAKCKWEKPYKKTKGMKVRFHDLRHGYASLMIEQGENIKYIQDQLGHSSPMVTLNVYAHLMKDSNQDAVRRLENAIFSTGHNLGTETKKDLNQVS